MSTTHIKRFLMAALLLFQYPTASVSAAGPPPARPPQACSRFYCVEVIPQAPFLPVRFETSYVLGSGKATTLVELEGGVVVVFQSQFGSKSSGTPVTASPRWRYTGRTAVSSACLNCEASQLEDKQFIGVAVTPIPHQWGAKISSAVDVCFWRMDIQTAAQGSGKAISIGDKVCVKDV